MLKRDAFALERQFCLTKESLLFKDRIEVPLAFSTFRVYTAFGFNEIADDFEYITLFYLIF